MKFQVLVKYMIGRFDTQQMAKGMILTFMGGLADVCILYTGVIPQEYIRWQGRCDSPNQSTSYP